MEHLILTRFNVPQTRHSLDRNGQAILDDSWMAHRVGLFEAVCLPSMRNQSTRDFRWICFFGTNTSDRWRTRIQSWSDFTPLEPQFVDAWPDMVPAIQRLIRPSTQYLITQRLDNDDALHRDAVKETARLAWSLQTEPVTVIDLQQGLCVTADAWYRRKCPLSQFIGLAERKPVDGPWRTAWHTNHVNMATTGPVIRLKLKDAWITTMHDRNLINTVWGGRWNMSVQWQRFKVVIHNALVRRNLRRGQPSRQWYPEKRIRPSGARLLSDFGIQGHALTAVGLKSPDA